MNKISLSTVHVTDDLNPLPYFLQIVYTGIELYA